MLIYASPFRPWSTRSNHGFGLPTLRRCFRYVSVSVRVFRSEDLENCSFFIYHLFGEELELVRICQPLPSCHGLLEVCGCVKVLFSLSMKMLSRPFFWFWHIGMLDGGHSVCSTCCCFLHVVRAVPMFTFSALVRTCSLCGPLSIRSHCFTFSSGGTCGLKMYAISVIFQISINDAGFVSFLALLRWSRAL